MAPRGRNIIVSLVVLLASGCQTVLDLDRYNLCPAQCDAASAAGDGAIYRINSGGPQVETFAADDDEMGGQPFSTAAAVDTSGVSLAAPMAVYQDYDYGPQSPGSFVYTFPNLTPKASYWIRLHFADIFNSTSGQRVFDVSANGQSLLAAFDVIKEAPGPFRAIVKEFQTTADDRGLVTIVFASRPGVDVAMVSGVELLTSP